MKPRRRAAPRRWAAACLWAALGLSLAASSARAEDLSPELALRLAAAHNPDLRASLAELRAAEASVRSAEGARVPVLFASGSAAYTERSSPAAKGLSYPDDKSLSAEAGVRFLTDVGTTVEVGAGAGRTVPSGTAQAAASPSSTGSVFLNVRQPLMRGAGADAVLGPRRQAEASLAANRASQAQSASLVARDALLAFWELWYAERSLAVQEEARSLAMRQYDDAKQRQEQLGAVARIDVLRFEAELRSVESSLAQAGVTRRSAALGLGQLLGAGEARASGFVAKAPDPIVARTPGGGDPGAPPELRALAAQVEVARDRVTVAKNSALPRLDLGLNATATSLFTNDLAGNTTGLWADRPAFVAMATLDFELPLGRSQADAEAQRATYDLEAARARLASRELALATEQATLQAELEASAAIVSVATDSARLQAELAEAERASLELGTTTTSEVVRAQQSARQAELARVRALVDAKNKEIRLLHGRGTLLARASGFGEVTP